ncbi:MAG: carbon monoxide dehydrogenase subunit G [Bacillota bacterium]|nr:MAG: carbon monoxide dehydrogenase [Bacillota bacterium]
MKVQFSGTEAIRAPKEQVRQFILDPNQVGRCLPDLQELTVADPTHATAIVKVGVGPVRGRFKLDIELQPGGDAATIHVRGSGMGSSLSMMSEVRLEETPEGTNLHWQADASVSGPLASVGGRLLEGQARKTVEQLFANIRSRLESVAV